MSTNQYVPILFYSERCANSKEVIGTIQALNKASLFRFVNVDTTPRQYLPPEVRAVPTLIFPDTKQVLSGKNNIFAHLSKPVQSRRDVPSARAPPTAPAEPLFWSFTDSSMSTGYSSFDGQTKTSEDQLRYSFLDGEIRTTGQEPPGGGGGTGGIDGPRTESSFDGSKSGRNDDVMNRLESMQSSRESEYAGVNPR
jgi:hypothetical protein